MTQKICFWVVAIVLMIPWCKYKGNVSNISGSSTILRDTFFSFSSVSLSILVFSFHFVFHFHIFWLFYHCFFTVIIYFDNAI